MQHFGKRCCVQHFALARHGEHLFGQVQAKAAITIGHVQQRGPRAFVERQRFARLTLNAGKQLLQRGLVQPVQHQDLTTRQQRAINLKARGFRCRAYEGHHAALDKGQEPILLGAVKSVNLINEQERAFAHIALRLGALKRGAQILHPGEHRRDRFIVQIGFRREQLCNGGLANARRSPKND